jgi:hypothetical protein
LKERSLAANLRQELGHWEGALAVGKQNKATFVASVDRKSVSFLSRTPAMSRPPFGVTPGERRKFHLLAIGIAMALILRGGGKWSVDAAISRSLSER